MESISITSNRFYEAWCRVTQDNRNQKKILKNWNHNTADYTKLMLSSNDSIVRKVSKVLELRCYVEYYAIDAVFYKEEDCLIGNYVPENQTWLRNIQIAFEHENYFQGGLYQEVAHLLITNCDLKVLVTYPNKDEDNTKIELDRLHSIINGSKDAIQIADESSFLLILGYEKEQNMWEGFVFKQHGWEKI